MKQLRNKSRPGIEHILLIPLTVTLLVAFFVTWEWLFLAGSVLLFTFQLAYADYSQRRRAILRNFPLIGRFRYMIEALRPKFAQYLETDLEGKPFNRRQRSIIYQRAKNVRDTVAFGMQESPYQPGYEWLSHSMYPVKFNDRSLKTKIGLATCRQPYDLSLLNIGAMSYGALSKTAVLAMSNGARLNGFAMNTGEGGISPYHLEGGADLIWQIGTGYFGCRKFNGHFDPHLFRENALRPNVKMIELKVSQGAKPGHGGILPAVKNTPEVAAIRNVEPGITIFSPGHHSSFSNAEELLSFIDYLKLLSDYKPVGIKLCIGSRKEFEDLCIGMRKTNIVPDFISIDGGEGGTGAAPLEFTDHVGMPLMDSLAFVSIMKRKYRLPFAVIASGKIVTAYDLLRALSLGAQACYSARGMMMALGCIQALVCDSGKCPVGITTQEKRLYRGIDVSDKQVRIANYHRNTLNAAIELMESCGYQSVHEVNARDFNRRLSRHENRTLHEIYFGSIDYPNKNSAIAYTQLN